MAGKRFFDAFAMNTNFHLNHDIRIVYFLASVITGQSQREKSTMLGAML